MMHAVLSRSPRLRSCAVPVLSAALLLTSGCAARGWQHISESWVNNDIDTLRQHWGEPDRNWVRADGKQIYQYHLEQVDPTCNQYWVVNDENRITDYYFEGDCENTRPATAL